MDGNYYIFLIYSFFFIGTTIFCLLLNSIFLKFAKNLGIRDQKGTVIRWSEKSKPALGGISIFMGFLISFSLYSIFFPTVNVFQNSPTVGLLFATFLAFLMGIADDAYNTRPLLKFFIQVACGVILFSTGTCIDIFESNWLNYLITVLWVVGMMNSINMLDNMDGITSIVSIFILISALMYMALHNMSNQIDFMVILGVIAALTAFLFYNWYPSKMYMGDTGSQFLGVFLAAIGIKYFWNSTTFEGSVNSWQQIFSVIVVFILPILDTTIVVINRVLRGQSPFIGGKDHTSHNLSYQGLSDSQVAFVFAGISTISLFITFFSFRFLEDWNWVHSISFSSYVTLLLLILYYITVVHKAKYDNKTPQE